MWIIIFVELITYGLAIAAFVYSGRESQEIFHESALRLNTFTGIVNTCFLLTSGYFMAVAVSAFKQKQVVKTQFFLQLTMWGGLMFCILKLLEFNSKLKEGLTISFNDFFTYYWILTGFHFIHVVVGLIILLVCYFSIKKNKFESVSLA